MTKKPEPALTIEVNGHHFHVEWKTCYACGERVVYARCTKCEQSSTLHRDGANCIFGERV